MSVSHRVRVDPQSLRLTKERGPHGATVSGCLPKCESAEPPVWRARRPVTRPGILYLTRTGLADPLGQSQVMGYLRGLSRNHDITLLTAEKIGDADDSFHMAALRADCAAHGIDWRPQRFRAGKIGAARNFATMFKVAMRIMRQKPIALIHARSYIPAAIARALWRRTRVPFVFDMRALWLDEMIEAGRLTAGSPMERVLRRMERLCLRDAAGVVSLTAAAVTHLRGIYPSELARQHVVVIPTCADLDRFPLCPPPDAPMVFGCVGSVTSGWFRLDWLDALFGAAASDDPTALFEVVTRDDPDVVRAGLPNVPTARLTIVSVPPEDVAARIAGHHASAMFYATGPARLGSSPTRLAEILATGRPVIANAGVGNVADIVTGHRVGVLMADCTMDAARAALSDLSALRHDPDLPDRARATAETLFSLEDGTRAYASLYDTILGSAS